MSNPKEKIKNQKAISFETTRLSNGSKIYSSQDSPCASTREIRSFKTTSSAKSKMSVRLSNLMAAMYPGITVGHRDCVNKVMLVPKTMGWLWNSEDTVTGVPFPRGWRPGAIALGVKKRSFRIRSISEPQTTPVGSKGKKTRRKLKNADSSIIRLRTISMKSETEIKVPPTLRVQKEGGVYRLTMQPIKHANAKKTGDEQPVQFKIADSSSGSNASKASSGSSSLKIEYMCTGALRKPMIKPEIAEMSTQWDTMDFQIKDTKKQEETIEATKDEKKKGKKKKSPKKETTEEEGTLNQDKKNAEEVKPTNDVKDSKPAKK